MDEEIKNLKQQKILDKGKKLSAIKENESCEDSKEEEEESLISAIKYIKLKYRSPLNTWILKPGEDSNRGCGIGVYSTLNEIKSTVSS
jgi:hypothetical protein